MGIRLWLRRHFLDAEQRLMLVAYAMILAAIITHILVQRELSPVQYYGALLAMSGFLALNFLMAERDVAGKPEDARFNAAYLLGGAALVLLANFWGLEGQSLLPYLLFVLASQAAVMIPFRYAMLYCLSLLAGWLLLIAYLGGTADTLLDNALLMSLGMWFALVFTMVAVRSRQQTERAEMLLAQLREASRELELARERERELAVAEERVRLAREIHDGLGHHLTVLNVQLQAASKLIERDPARAAGAIDTCREVAAAALAEVRQSVASMRQGPLDNRTLAEALRNLVADFDRRSPIEACFEQEGAPRSLPPAAALTLYRAAQEGLTNAQKHGAARHARVALRFTPDTVSLSVHNDGTTNDRSTSGSGFGLAGLRERAEHLGGLFAAGSQPTGGFLLELTLPLEAAALPEGSALAINESAQGAHGALA